MNVVANIVASVVALPDRRSSRRQSSCECCRGLSPRGHDALIEVIEGALAIQKAGGGLPEAAWTPRM